MDLHQGLDAGVRRHPLAASRAHHGSDAADRQQREGRLRREASLERYLAATIAHLPHEGRHNVVFIGGAAGIKPPLLYIKDAARFNPTEAQ